MQLIAWSIPAFIAFMLLEAWLARRRGLRLYRLPVAISDLSCGITSQLFNLATFGATLAIYVWVYQARLFEMDARSAWVWLFAMLGVDLLYYFWHRASHEVNILWAAHIVHHHSEDYNLAVALRQAFLTGFTSLPFFLPLALLGVPPLVYAAAKALNTLYQFWIHTELVGHLGPVERVLNTPSHHRVHHAINPHYLDRNYAGILITWDRIFGTFEPERERPVYGTTKPLRSLNPLWANFHYFGEIAGLVAAAPRWRDRLYALFAHPGWRPGAASTPLDHDLGPDALRLRASQRYDAPARRGLGLYITAQTILAVPATMLLLIYGPSLSAPQVLAGVGLVSASAVVWAGLFERRRWAWPVELLRVAASVLLLWSIAG